MSERKDPETYELDVVLQWCGPSFAAEQRFVQLEKDRVKRVLARHRNHGAGGQLIALAFGESGSAWRSYDQLLTKYSKALDKHEAHLGEGVVPFKALITNHDSIALHNVAVSLEILHGEFDFDLKAPDRPMTPEGSKPYDRYKAVMSLPLIGGFARHHIVLDSTKISAEFSRLNPGQDAFLVNQIVHIHMQPKTKLMFTLRAKELDGLIEGEMKIKL